MLHRNPSLFLSPDNMVFNGATLNGAYFRKHELQIAAALWLYCKNADGTYADAELIREIIFDMRKMAGCPPPCQGIETFLRDSSNILHREAWREIQVNDVEWRGKAEAAYWSWRNNMTELVER